MRIPFTFKTINIKDIIDYNGCPISYREVVMSVENENFTVSRYNEIISDTPRYYIT